MGKHKNRVKIPKKYRNKQETNDSEVKTEPDNIVVESAETSVKRKSSKADLDRKREKNRINKLRKRQLKRGEVLDSKVKNDALNYLKCWHKDKCNWKFMKVRQVWLLKNTYNLTNIPQVEFEILLEYLDGIQGQARSKSRQQAEEIIKKLDKKWTEADEKEETDLAIYDRARKIIQLL